MAAEIGAHAMRTSRIARPLTKMVDLLGGELAASERGGGKAVIRRLANGSIALRVCPTRTTFGIWSFAEPRSRFRKADVVPIRVADGVSAGIVCLRPESDRVGLSLSCCICTEPVSRKRLKASS